MRYVDEAPLAPVAAAQARSELGGSLVIGARRMNGAGRALAVTMALTMADAATDLWRGAALPPALEPQRERALARVAADRSAAEALGAR